MYRRYWKYTSIHDLAVVFTAVTASSILMAGFVVVGMNRLFVEFSRVVILNDWLMTLAVAGGLRVAVRVLSEANDAVSRCRAPPRAARVDCRRRTGGQHGRAGDAPEPAAPDGAGGIRRRRRGEDRQASGGRPGAGADAAASPDRAIAGRPHGPHRDADRPGICRSHAGRDVPRGRRQIPDRARRVRAAGWPRRCQPPAEGRDCRSTPPQPRAGRHEHRGFRPGQGRADYRRRRLHRLGAGPSDRRRLARPARSPGARREQHLRRGGATPPGIPDGANQHDHRRHPRHRRDSPASSTRYVRRSSFMRRHTSTCR